MEFDKTYVKKSNISGYGLFTKTFIPKETIILDFRNKQYCWYELPVSNLTPYQISHNWYVMIDEYYCKTTDIISEITFMNHSRTPNCDWKVEDLYIITNKNIDKDEELVIDYRLEKRNNRTSLPLWI